MAAMTSLRDTIKEIVHTHLTQHGGLVMGQCLTAVGWVGGTLPELYEDDGMVELSMSDVAGSGFAVGAALAMKRPMYVIRYQGFNWFNAPIVINYAAKSKEMWGRPCPMFIRSIAMEGAIGPVAGSSHHALYYRMPGIKILSPMSPGEYKAAYDAFMADDEVYYISEHRRSYDHCDEFSDVVVSDPDLVLFPISITRFAAREAAAELNRDGYRVGVVNLFRIKPLCMGDGVSQLAQSRNGGLVLDDDYPDGIAKAIANDLSNEYGKPVRAMGLEDRSSGFSKDSDNLPPDKDGIVAYVTATVAPNRSMAS